eukprot:TRINITY_DN21304_c0_g1_i1.p1 TRINITY_DN21304_c0_g1~~TRINITY_DN21304_c0_g1_i1.p1  ORF type:complete len:435 (+),score=67.42 TRINITY_DN21304_c0_g1_i1:59-1306(+)
MDGFSDSDSAQTAPVTPTRQLALEGLGGGYPGTPPEQNFDSRWGMGGESPKKQYGEGVSPRSYYDSDDSEADTECSRFAEEFIQKGNVIGQGSFGVVSKVQHRLDGQIYAVKKSKEVVIGRARENRLQEVYAVASLPRCQHIVKYYDCWIERSYLYIRFEYCELGSIAPVCDWTYASLLQLFYQIAIGLQSLHGQSVVHLDVKADNIYMTEKSGKTIYKLGDFGLVRKVGDENRQRWAGENDEEGDSRYLCQKFLGDKKYPKAADVFALAATVYEAARGVPLPNRGDEWKEIREFPVRDLTGKYPEEFIKLLRDCMDPSPELRPACLDILSNPIFAEIKQSSGQAQDICDMEAELRKLRAQLVRSDPPSASTNQSSSPGLSPSDCSSSPSPHAPVAKHLVAAEVPPPSLSQGRFD